MMFYTIQSPGNRNEEVKKYLELKKYLRTRDSAEKTGEYSSLEGLSKFFKPVSQPIQELKKDVKALPESLAKALPALPGAPALPALPALPDDPASVSSIEEKEGRLIVPGDEELTDYMLTNYDNKLKDLIKVDKEDRFFKINGRKLIIKENIKYEGKTYNRTPELLDLIFSDIPKQKSLLNKKATEDYKQILKDSNVLFHPTGKGQNRKLSNSVKWSLILSETYKEAKKEKEAKEAKEATQKPQSSGKGYKQSKTVFLSANPVTLADRLALLCSSAKAGNTGVRNEMVEICKELVRMGAMTRQQKTQILNNY